MRVISHSISQHGPELQIFMLRTDGYFECKSFQRKPQVHASKTGCSPPQEELEDELEEDELEEDELEDLALRAANLFGARLAALLA